MNKRTTPPSPKYYSDEIGFGQQIRSLLAHKCKIALAVLAGGIAGAVFSPASTPVYRADTMLKIETRQNQILTEINDIFSDESQPSGVELRLIQSRMVLGKAVGDLQLNQLVGSKYFPVFGGLVHNLNGDVDPELEVADFEASEDWISLPFELTVKDSKSYALMLPDRHTVEGFTGEPLKINNKTVLKVDHILADASQKFTLAKFSRLSAIENIKKQLPVVGKGKTSPIVSLSYTGTDPKEVSVILNSIANNYVGQNRERNVQVTTNGLVFISEELPRMKETLQEAENKLNAYREKSGSLDIPLESKSTLKSLTNVESQITASRTEGAGLVEMYTPEYPAYKAVLDKLSVLEHTKKEINRQIAELPNTQQEVIRLARNVTTNQTTYVQLLNKQQKLNIMGASVQGNVRIVDHTFMPELPVAPRKTLITLLSALIAGALASVWCLFHENTRQDITSSDEVETLDLEVSALVPYSKIQQGRDTLKQTLTSLNGRSSYLLASENATDAAVEAIHALRTNIYSSVLDAKSNVLMITSTAPETGKSFIFSNLATVIAQSGKKILLTDADMRKGYLEQLFSTHVTPGLSGLLSGGVSPVEVVQQTSIENLFFISHDDYTQSSSELLMNRRLGDLIEQASKRYDYVITDTPPVLTVTDAAIVGQHVGMTLMVARYDYTTMQGLDNAVCRLAQNNINIEGVIPNSIKCDAFNSYSCYSYGSYTAGSDKKAAKSKG